MRPASCPRIFCHRALLSHPLIPFPLLPRSYAYLLQYLPCFPPPPCFLATRAWMAPRPPLPPFRLFFTTPPPLLVPSTEKPSYFKAENIPKSLFCKKKKKIPLLCLSFRNLFLLPPHKPKLPSAQKRRLRARPDAQSEMGGESHSVFIRPVWLGEATPSFSISFFFLLPFLPFPPMVELPCCLWQERGNSLPFWPRRR